MRKGLFSRLARQGMAANRQFYLPYLLALGGTAAGFYNICAVAADEGLRAMRGADYVCALAAMGTVLTALFSVAFLWYINSFLMKRRTRELALYNVLGMGKGHIARVLLWESVYTALLGVGGGLLAGVFFQKLVTLILRRLLRLSVPLGFSVSGLALGVTAALLLGVLALLLGVNVLRMGRTDTIALLRAGEMGEREPKSRFFLAAAGVLTLGAGYGLALTTRNSSGALGIYFVAVFLVVIGTFCLFTAGSVAVLKLLRRNKNYYYRTDHFIGVSGMLFRMKRNAVGLANICILSTMVLVMLSGTLTLYLGMDAVTARQAPGDLNFLVWYDPTQGEPDAEALARRITAGVEDQGQSVTKLETCRSFILSVREEDGVWYDTSGDRYSSLTTLAFLPAADYAALTGTAPVELGEDEVFLAGGDGRETVKLADRDGALMTFAVAGTGPEVPAVAAAGSLAGKPVVLVLRDLAAVEAAQQRFLGAGSMCCEFRADITGTQAEKEALGETVTRNGLTLDGRPLDYTGTGHWEALTICTRPQQEEMNLGLSGGFLFLGVFLGLLFLMATALILYYKQISEGYEDRRRFQILQQVGLSRRDIRRWVNGQVLTVFFLPLAAAAVHLAFNFRLMLLLLQIFALHDPTLTLLCTLGTLAVFTGLYTLVFRLTARAYYKIVA